MANTGSLSVPKPQFPALNSPQRLGQPAETGRRKVALKPGRSLMDWVRLGQKSGRALNGLSGRTQDVTIDELAKHNTPGDTWMLLRGRVYNVSPYMEYHPGGAEELMKGAGIDGTNLFNDVHQWVNFESMLEKCYIGQLKSVFAQPTKAPPKHKLNASSATVSCNSFKNNTGVNEVELTYDGKPRARYDWYQSSNNVTITIYAKCKRLSEESLTIDRNDRDFHATVFLDDSVYSLHLELAEQVTSCYQIHIRKGSVHRLEIIMEKATVGSHWRGLGKQLENHNIMMETKDRELKFRNCKLLKVDTVTHDSKLLTFELPEGSWMQVPIGYHVYLKAKVNGVEVNRPYTVVLPSLNFKGKSQDSRLIHLMIKVYTDGLLTPTIGMLKEGDTIEVSDYEGSFLDSRLQTCQELVLLAAGTGFTPMIRLINQSLVAHSNRKVKLFFFNKTENDILWKQEVDNMVSEYERMEVTHVLSAADDSWEGLTGRIRNEILENDIHGPQETTKDKLICICGPTPFIQTAYKVVKQRGTSIEMVHLFVA